MTLNMIAEYYTKKNNLVRIYRDKYGKWYVKFDYDLKQQRLNASEIVRYLANALERK